MGYLLCSISPRFSKINASILPRYKYLVNKNNSITAEVIRTQKQQKIKQQALALDLQVG